MAGTNNLAGKPKPFINVTPLIDVLLVLLIIFMVVAPLKQTRFEAKVPTPPDNQPPVRPNDNTLVVIIGTDHSLKLNSLVDMGTVEDTTKLSAKLVAVFSERLQNHAYSWEMMGRTDLPDALRVEKTVFIRAPRDLKYGEVVKVIDGIKGAGAMPIGLQIDGLD